MWSVVAVAAVHKVGLGDLMDHEGVVVGRGAALHLAELGEDAFGGRLIGEVGGGFVELVVPLVACALMVVPPEGEGFLVRAMDVVIPGLVPGLRGVAGRGREAVVEDYSTAGVFLVHGFEDFEDCGIVEVGADFVLQGVLDDRRVRAVGFDHLDAFNLHKLLGELVAFGLGLRELNTWVGDCAFSGWSRGWSADGEFASAGLEVAEEAEAVVGAEDVFLGEIAVEVETVEI